MKYLDLCVIWMQPLIIGDWIKKKFKKNKKIHHHSN